MFIHDFVYLFSTKADLHFQVYSGFCDFLLHLANLLLHDSLNVHSHLISAKYLHSAEMTGFKSNGHHSHQSAFVLLPLNK